MGLADGFPGHFWLTEPETQSIWSEGVLVLDASILLSFYRYSENTRRAMFNVLERFEGRVFVPHQAAVEFHRNRLGVIRQQVATYKDVEDDLAKAVEGLRRRARELRRHPVLEADEVLQRIDAFEGDLTEYIKARNLEHPNSDLTPTSLMRDPIRQEIVEVIGRSVGPAYDLDRLTAIEAEGRQRFDGDVPPGFRDQGKGDSRQFGDLILWFQVLDFAAAASTPVLLATDDEKDDWWWRFDGKTLGPRAELVVEMRATAGQPMLMYTSRGLLAAARDYLSEEVSDQAIDEIEQVARDLRSRRIREQVDCPHCGTPGTTVEIGVVGGSSAIALCNACDHRFHVHRVGSGQVSTSLGSLGRRIQVRCPDCDTPIRVDFRDGDDGPVARVCLECFANLEVDALKSVGVVGHATVVDAELTGEDEVACPRCGVDHHTFARRGPSIFAICYSGEPHLLLRAEAP